MTVAIDQTMWYVDLLGYILARRFPVGVCKYLLQAQHRTWTRLATSWHHVFFIPVVVWVRSVLSQSIHLCALTPNTPKTRATWSPSHPGALRHATCVVVRAMLRCRRFSHLAGSLGAVGAFRPLLRLCWWYTLEQRLPRCCCFRIRDVKLPGAVKPHAGRTTT